MQSRLILEVSTPSSLMAAVECGASALLAPNAAWGVELRRLTRAGAVAASVFVAIPAADDVTLDAELDVLGADLPDGVFLADCRCRADLQQVTAKLTLREALAGQPDGAVRIMAMAAQSPAGALTLSGLAGSFRRLAGLVFDADALACAARLDPAAPALAAAEAQVIFAAAAAGVPAFFVPPSQEDAEILVERCVQALRAGYGGVVVQTPAQYVAVRARLAMIDKRP
jgi:citrate lyase subunit beta/citryl-CoA lyase